DGIRDKLVTGVQTCALPIFRGTDAPLRLPIAGALLPALIWPAQFVALDLAAGVHWPAELIGGSVVVSVGVGALLGGLAARPAPRSEERRVGKEGRARGGGSE